MKTPASWFSVSNAWPAEVGEVDLRNKADAQAVEKFLVAADVGDLCVALGAPRPKKERSQKQKVKKARNRAGWAFGRRAERTAGASSRRSVISRPREETVKKTAGVE